MPALETSEASLGVEDVVEGKGDAFIARIFLVAHTASVFHAAIHETGISNNLVTRSALNVTYKAHTTAIFFVGWVVKPVFGGEVAVKCYRHNLSQLMRAVISAMVLAISFCRLKDAFVGGKGPRLLSF